MFDNLYKKDAAPPPAAATPITEAELQGWREKLRAAEGDDRALLQLAHQAPGVDLKLAALAALTQEDAIKQATREFRDQDKRLYRAAKSRWEAAVARREALAQAPVLIAAAHSLLEQESIPANRLVELDRAWAALSEALPDPALASEFAVVRSQLGARVRERGEAGQALERWLAAADAVIHALTAGLAGVAAGAVAPASPKPSSTTAEQAAALLQLLNDVPGAADAAADPRRTEKIDAANRALALAASVVQRAEFLRSLPVAGLADESDEKTKIEQWRSFPEVSDGELQALLTHRFSEWRNACGEERQREREARRTHEGEVSAERRKRRLAQMQGHVEQAEAAHAAGQVAELTRLITQIDGALKAGAVDAALTRRIESLRQEQLRLREWQRWSGGQRREELVAEAQGLAGMAAEKIALKAHADAIEKLRQRWKELDKLGGATSKTLWLAFDGALKAAYAPVAAHLDKLKAARQENLAARNRIIDDLLKAGASQPDSRALARTLEEARITWRKLGPVEHTVPRDAQKGDQAVSARFAAVLQALEAPLTQAYRDATAERERLIAAAKSLAEATPLARDAIDMARALQAQWQAHAKGLPLPRREESALWTAFKAATDAVFTARDAARSARDAERAARESESNAPIKAREAIIDTLLALPSGSAAEIKRALAVADTSWRASPRVAGPQASRLEARYRAARDAAAKRLREIADHAAQARFDALIAAMRLCDEREAAGEPSPDLETRWSAIADLPAPWKAAVEARFRGAAPAKPQPLPDTLLNLELACGLDSPAEFTAARRQLKMQALKVAMENRRPDAGASPADIERWLLEAAATPRPDELSRSRLEKILAAVRARC
jgi:DNA repair protein SbcC/Rad50